LNLTLWGNIALKRLQNYTIPKENITLYQKAILNLLLDSTPQKSINLKNLIDLPKFEDKTKDQRKEEFHKLQYADFVRPSFEDEENWSGYFITEKGRNIILEKKAK
jgi:hypothetical protein